MARTPYVVDDPDGFDPDAIFTSGRDQIVVAVNVAPTFGSPDLTLLANVVDEGNDRGFALVREQVFKDHYLLVVFDAYDEDSED